MKTIGKWLVVALMGCFVALITGNVYLQEERAASPLDENNVQELPAYFWIVLQQEDSLALAAFAPYSRALIMDAASEGREVAEREQQRVAPGTFTVWEDDAEHRLLALQPQYSNSFFQVNGADVQVRTKHLKDNVQEITVLFNRDDWLGNFCYLISDSRISSAMYWDLAYQERVRIGLYTLVAGSGTVVLVSLAFAIVGRARKRHLQPR